MTEYQLKVLREVDGIRDEKEIAASTGGQYGTCYKSLDRMAHAGLLALIKRVGGYAVWRRTPAGDAALADADKTLIPRQPIEARLF